MRAILRLLLFGLRLQPYQCSNFQMSLPRLPSFFPITLNYLGINETCRAKWAAQWWYVHFYAFSFLPKKASDPLFLFLFDKPLFSFFVSLYPNPNLSFFWITVIGLSMPCSPFPKPFPTRATFFTTCFMPNWVVFDSFGTRIFYSSPTSMAFMNSKDLKEHSNIFSSVLI